jgi:hypothetical protein
MDFSFKCPTSLCNQPLDCFIVWGANYAFYKGFYSIPLRGSMPMKTVLMDKTPNARECSILSALTGVFVFWV